MQLQVAAKLATPVGMYVLGRPLPYTASRLAPYKSLFWQALPFEKLLVWHGCAEQLAHSLWHAVPALPLSCL